MWPSGKPVGVISAYRTGFSPCSGASAGKSGLPEVRGKDLVPRQHMRVSKHHFHVQAHPSTDPYSCTHFAGAEMVCDLPFRDLRYKLSFFHDFGVFCSHLVAH